MTVSVRRLARVLGCGILLVASAAPCAADAIRVQVESARVRPGQEVDVPIGLAGTTSVGALHAEVVFDAAVLQAASVKKGPALGANGMLESRIDGGGRVVIGVVSPDGVRDSGALALVRFRVTGQAGTRSPLRLEKVEAWQTKSLHEVLVVSEAGEVVVGAAGPSFPWQFVVAGVFGLLLLVLLGRAMTRRRSS